MCFSMTADLVVGSALVPVAVATLREVKRWREVPFALLPTVFAVHQFLEAAVWPNGVVSEGMAHWAMRAYVFIALPLLPALVPSAILMLEPRGARLRVALYVVAVIGPAVLSGYRSIVVFGWVNLVGLIAVAVLYVRAFASLWCVYAAVLSVLVLAHMVLVSPWIRRHRTCSYPVIASASSTTPYPSRYAWSRCDDGGEAVRPASPVFRRGPTAAACHRAAPAGSP